ncbi:hypothetical protein LAZ67_3002506 [Cordylochernes scorpioides]|uniref:PiggyBac transposable element-derived protein domain-containing protein n=1 Tax=Cordylochernes scorpioides TaxID=51811 RepID=A0ABY6KCI9_9ARAC|nr:hypothetical protein LAZ67_3002506 [Cordylochernes scorpioides]
MSLGARAPRGGRGGGWLFLSPHFWACFYTLAVFLSPLSCDILFYFLFSKMASGSECSAFSEDTEVYSLYSEFEESDEGTFEDKFSDEEVDENQPSSWVRVYTPFSTSKTLTFGEVCGPQHLPPSIIRPIEYFLFFITMNLMKDIVTFTNKCAQTFLESNRDNLPPFSMKLAWKDTTLDEMMAFIAVILNMGNVKKNQIRDYWSKNELLETPWFGKVMSRGRFELLYSCFSLIDESNLVPSSHSDYNPTE